jgi:hypothetical protein
MPINVIAVLKLVIQFVLVSIVLGLIGWTIYFVSNRNDPAKAPSDKWPEWYRVIVHVYPKEYNKTSSNVIVTGTQSDVFTATTPAKCATDPKKGCSKDEECVGFVYTKGSNTSTCTTFSSIDGFFDDKRVTGNTLYTIDGNEPGQYYATYTSNIPGYSGSPFVPYTAASYFNCASNCSSNTLCSGFAFNSNGICVQFQDAKMTSNLHSDTTQGYTSYVLNNSLGYFQPANLS